MKRLAILCLLPLAGCSGLPVLNGLTAGFVPQPYLVCRLSNAQAHLEGGLVPGQRLKEADELCAPLKKP